jgi:O-antigen/teichoic acid export membrane protein
LDELKAVGFSIFFTSGVILFFCFLLGIVVNNPELIIKNGSLNYQNLIISKKLFLILIVAALLTVPLKLCQLIFAVRLEEYIMQKINICANILRLLSIFFLFSNGKYLIVEYFALIQFLNIAVVFICFYLIKKNYSISLKDIIPHFKFDKDQFKKTSYLAFSGFYIMVIWIIYYELDQIFIGKLVGSSEVAIYAIGFSLLSFTRGLLGILYSPFNHRFNYFTGLNDFDGLKKYYNNVVINLSPIIIGFIFSFYLFMNNLVISWVGFSFEKSVIIAQLLILCNFFAFISYPTSMLLKALVKLKKFNIFYTCMPFIFFCTVYFGFEKYGISIFGFSKLLIFCLVALFYTIFYTKYLNKKINSFLNIYLFSHIISFLFLIVYYNIAVDYLPLGKSPINLFIVLLTILGGIIIYYLSYFLFNPSCRKYFFERVNFLIQSIQ